MARDTVLPAPINRLPLGLLDFLGIKSGGKYPSQLLDSLQPTMDLLSQYTNINSEEYALTTTQLTPGGYDIQQMEWTNSTPTNIITAGVGLEVPQDQAWYIQLYNVRCQFNAVAGSEGDFGPEVVPITGSHRYGGAIQGFTTSAATYQRGMCRALIQGPIWALPGSRISIRRFGALIAAGGTGDVSGTIRFARFRF